MSGHGNDDLAEIQSDSGVSVGSGGGRAGRQGSSSASIKAKARRGVNPLWCRHHVSVPPRGT